MKKLLSLIGLKTFDPYAGLPDAAPKGIARTVKPSRKVKFNDVFLNAKKQLSN